MGIGLLTRPPPIPLWKLLLHLGRYRGAICKTNDRPRPAALAPLYSLWENQDDEVAESIPQMYHRLRWVQQSTYKVLLLVYDITVPKEFEEENFKQQYLI